MTEKQDPVFQPEKRDWKWYRWTRPRVWGLGMGLIYGWGHKPGIREDDVHGMMVLWTAIVLSTWVIPRLPWLIRPCLGRHSFKYPITWALLFIGIPPLLGLCHFLWDWIPRELR